MRQFSDTGAAIRAWVHGLLVSNCNIRDNRVAGGAVTIKAFDLALNNGANIAANIRPDPALFVDPIGPDKAPKSGDENYRLGAGSKSIDSGDSSIVSAPLDLDGNPRRVDDAGVPDTGAGAPPAVDRGAYEHQSDSPGVLGPADINGDGTIDVHDLGVLIGSFGAEVPDGTGADLDADGVVSVRDFSMFVLAFSGRR